MAQWSKEVFAKNLRVYMDRAGKNQRDMAEIIGVSTATFSEWINAKKYPRIDKVEMLANYFGILKSDLIEEHVTEDMKKDHDTITDAVIRMRTDAEFFSIVERILKMEPSELSGVQQMLDALRAFSK